MDSNMCKEGLALISITKLDWKSKTNSMKGGLLVYYLPLPKKDVPISI